MKTHLPFRWAIICLGLSLFTALHAQTDIEEKVAENQAQAESKHIRVQVEFIDVSHEQFTDLMFGEKPVTNDGELRKQVAQLIKDGKASIMETLLCTSTSGVKATTDSTEEFIYPTEYEPATIPGIANSKEENGTDKPKSNDIAKAIGPQPRSFEPRNLGSTLEIEPILRADQKSIYLRFTPEIVYHVGNKVWAEWKDSPGSPIQMPTFYRLAVSSAVTLTDGHYMLVAALTPKSKEGNPDTSRKLMIFVKADVITTGP